MTGISEEDEWHNAKGKGLLNEDGAWCWREGCTGERYMRYSFSCLNTDSCWRLFEIDEGYAEDF